MENKYIQKDFTKIIIPQGSILYCSDARPFNIDLEENFPFFFCFFHPSEYENEYITKITLKKDISLFFTIDFYEKTIDDCEKIFLINLVKKENQNKILHEELKKKKIIWMDGLVFNQEENIQIFF